MTTQKPISKSPISDAFLSKNAEGNYLSNGCFCARCKNITGFPFTGKEKDPETGYSYFGARYLDHELMTMWLSVDPMADKYPSISPYAYCAWNPLNFVDPDGRSGVPTIDKRNRIITITSKLYFYGPKASPELSRAIATGIASQWNGSNATYELNGVTYRVRFGIQYETISFEKALELAKDNTNKKNNFIWIGDAPRGSSHTMQYKEQYGYGGNSFWLTVQDYLANSTTPAHEFGHGLGLNHPLEDLSGCTERPDIMIPRDTQYGPKWSLKTTEGTYIVNPNSRRVTAQNVQEALECSCGNVRNIIFDYNGTPVEM
jgi:RHS repeat-associated protein